MKKILKTYQFELKPNKQQKVLLDKHFGSCRYIYNYFLNQRVEQYKVDKKSSNYYEQSTVLTQLKKQEDTSWLKEINAQSLQFSLKCLDVAYSNFFKGLTKFPKFKSRKEKDSFTVPQNIKLQNNRLFIPKFQDGIKIIQHQEFEGKINRCTLSKTPTQRYLVSILVEQTYTPKTKTGKSCGIDLGIKDFAISSDGVKFKNHTYTKKYASKLKTAQKHLSRKQKGSNSFEKQRRKVAKIHEKISNSRKDNLHKVTNELITNYDIISVEDLNVKTMVKNKRLSKSISDASWGTFIRLLEYKANWNDKQVVKINRFFPSSKTCNCCGYVNKDLKLSTRHWTCVNGHHLDRDINASINILNEGLKILSSGIGDYRGGGSNKTSLKKQKSVKPLVDER